MPVYEYQCESCGKESEAIQKFSDAPLVDCESCGKKGALKKLVSKSSFALKGSGWYTTDYKKSSKPSVESSNEAPSEAAKGNSAPTDVKQSPAAPVPTASSV